MNVLFIDAHDVQQHFKDDMPNSSLNHFILTSILSLTILNTSPLLNAHGTSTDDTHPLYTIPIIADLSLLKTADIPIMYKDEEANVGYAVINSTIEKKLSHMAHLLGRCGNYERLPEIPQNLITVQNLIHGIRAQSEKNYQISFLNPITLVEKPEITNALQQLRSDNILESTQFLSSFKSRYNKQAQPNQHIQPFMDRLAAAAQFAQFPITIETISHQSTKQLSIKVTLVGATRPDEYIILGGHLDSISGWGGSGKTAPGADDNASGSAALYETFRVLTQQTQPERSIEFYWYAGEESGLLGSSEIAEQAKQQQKDIIAVLQLDMTSYPGDGPLKITSMTDFTNLWLRDFLKAVNQTYLNVTIQEDQCGYGCSDHASWYRRGFPTLFPTESKFNSSFKAIHTEKDVVSPLLNFEHALIFSKIAITMAMELGNSTLRQPAF